MICHRLVNAACPDGNRYHAWRCASFVDVNDGLKKWLHVRRSFFDLFVVAIFAGAIWKLTATFSSENKKD
jgi:hypothetical protein